LLRTVSGKKTLVKMLKDGDSFATTVLKCVADSSRTDVVGVTRTVVDNPLYDDDGSRAPERQLLEQHLGFDIGSIPIETWVRFNSSETWLLAGPSTWRHELTILYQRANLPGIIARQYGFSYRR
jgi:hypothetical protein